MGLDFIELIIDTEKTFQIKIADSNAEKVSTVQDLVGLISEILSIKNDDVILKDNIFLKLTEIIKSILDIDIPILQPDLVSKILPFENKEKWYQIQNALKLEIVLPYIKGEFKPSFISKLFGLILQKPDYDYKIINFSQLVDVICAVNWKKFIDISNIKSIYEVYVCMMYIINDKLGVDYYEILPSKKFIDDFRID